MPSLGINKLDLDLEVITMFSKMHAAAIAILVVAAIPLPADGADPHDPPGKIELTPGLLALIREEMREIATGIQDVALSLATGNWESIEQTSGEIRASYILDRKLTATQAQELTQALPEHFRQLDADFHLRAGKLAEAALTRDPEIAAFHYSRLIESCAQCHAAYARSRFPGFSSPAQKAHHH